MNTCNARTDFKQFKDVTPEQERHEKEMNRYRANWDTPFLAPTVIYAVSGNTDSSDFESAFSVDKVVNRKNKAPEFTSWKALAKHLRHYGDFYGATDNDIEMEWYKEDGEYIARDGGTDLLQYDALPLWDMFEAIVQTQQLDPVIFVEAHNPLVRWLVDVRKLSY